MESLCLFYKIFEENKSVYLFDLIPKKKKRKLNYNARNTDKITFSHTKHNFSTVIEWSKLDPSLRSAAGLSVVKENL